MRTVLFLLAILGVLTCLYTLYSVEGMVKERTQEEVVGTTRRDARTPLPALRAASCVVDMDTDVVYGCFPTVFLFGSKCASTSVYHEVREGLRAAGLGGAEAAKEPRFSVGLASALLVRAAQLRQADGASSGSILSDLPQLATPTASEVREAFPYHTSLIKGQTAPPLADLRNYLAKVGFVCPVASAACATAVTERMKKTQGSRRMRLVDMDMRQASAPVPLPHAPGEPAIALIRAEAAESYVRLPNVDSALDSTLLRVTIDATPDSLYAAPLAWLVREVVAVTAATPAVVQLVCDPVERAVAAWRMWQKETRLTADRVDEVVASLSGELRLYQTQCREPAVGAQGVPLLGYSGLPSDTCTAQVWERTWPQHLARSCFAGHVDAWLDAVPLAHWSIVSKDAAISETGTVLSEVFQSIFFGSGIGVPVPPSSTLGSWNRAACRGPNAQCAGDPTDVGDAESTGVVLAQVRARLADAGLGDLLGPCDAALARLSATQPSAILASLTAAQQYSQ
jgi:hypothetical protein